MFRQACLAFFLTLFGAKKDLLALSNAASASYRSAKSDCRRVNLGFLDHRNFRLEDYQADPDTLVVDDAGRDLYLV